jgi:hypothetical protein
LSQYILDGVSFQESKNKFKWKRMLVAEREQQSVIGGRGLQLEIE